MTIKKVLKHISNPALYRKLSEPVDSYEAIKMGEDFYNELQALREKYKVLELVVAFAINSKEKDGTEKLVIRTGALGGVNTSRLIMTLFEQTRMGYALLVLLEEMGIATFK